MNNPVYSLIIGNISGARDPSDPDPEWDNHRKGAYEAEKNPQEIVEGSAVQTRSQVRKEKEKFKTLKVPTISEN